LKALVNGGASSIGTTIAKELVLNSAEVVVLDNVFSGCRINVSGLPGVRLLEKDVRDAAAVDTAMDEGLPEYIRWARTEVVS
jgi:UDP-glucose 4-epimerase